MSDCAAVGERQPQLALRINTVGIQNVLELAARHELKVNYSVCVCVYAYMMLCNCSMLLIL
jgi:hypothetical protein